MKMYRSEDIVVKYERWCENRIREGKNVETKAMKEDSHGLPELKCCWK